jgi:hypothetical protein
LGTILLSATIDQAEIWFHSLVQPLQEQGERLALLPSPSDALVNGARPAAQQRNGSPALLLLPLADLATVCTTWKRNGLEQPLLFAGMSRGWFQLGPGLSKERSFCLACLEQQFTYFPGIAPGGAGAAGADGRLPDEVIGRLAQRLAPEIVAFIRCSGRGFLERGYWLRYALQEQRRHEYRLLRNPFCEICSVHAHYPSEAIYIAGSG